MNYWKVIKKNNTPSTSGISEEFLSEMNSKSKILEVGCGSGRIISESISKGHFVYGIDINKNEVSSLMLKYKSNKNVILEVNDITNKDFNLNIDYKFDYIFLNGLLGALNLGQRRIALQNILKVMHIHTVVHLSEFLLFEECDEMKKRYLKDFVVTGEYGSFFVYTKEGKRLYQTHNFRESEITDLVVYNFKIIKREVKKFVSYSGKMKPGIILLLKIKS